MALRAFLGDASMTLLPEVRRDHGLSELWQLGGEG
ncbi:MAG: hypothetical protein RLZZ117_2721 [Cyanobacteriota bacterium]|jgi:hypothetical protein